MLFWRFISAAAFSWVFLLLSGPRRSSLFALSRRRVLVLVLLGSLYVGNSYAFIASLQVVSISMASIIAYLYPAIVAVMATRFVRRLEGRRAWVALGVSIVGIALTVGGIPAGEQPPLWGLALAFANPLIYATWIILQARLAGERPGDGSLVVDEVEIPPGDADVTTDLSENAPDPSPAAALMTTATAALYAVLLLGSGGSISPLEVPGTVWPACWAWASWPPPSPSRRSTPASSAWAGLAPRSSARSSRSTPWPSRSSSSARA